MSQHDQDLQQEQQLLEHFREHSQGEPSAAVDALILAAARQAVEPPRPSLSQRLHAWLFGAGFAPMVALWLSSRFGLIAAGGYLLSGALGTLAALWLNRELARTID